MDENNNVIPSGATSETVTPSATSTSSDYVIGGPSTPVVEPVPTAVPETTATEPTPAAVPESSASEPTPVEAPSTADIYEKANSAAINPTSEPVTETPIYTTEPAVTAPTYSYSDPTASFSSPASTTYASTDSTYSDTTYNSTSAAPVSTGMATASLICGIVSILASCCCCFGGIISIPGIICGCMQKPTEDGKKPGSATAGIITSIVGILISIISGIFVLAIGMEDLDYFY